MYRLIIADDEKNIREGLADCYPWAELGFEIAEVCPDGKAALDYAERCCVDVVLSDIRMPAMDGLQLASRLYRDYPDIKVVLLSGFAEFEYAQEALRFGVKAYILKPIQYENLISVFTDIRSELDLAHGQAKPDIVSAGYYDQIVESVSQYLEQNYRNASLEQASLLVALSPNYLSKIFKRKKGMNFSEYLLEVKMRKAAGLLNDITLRTYEIASLVGYDNPKNFTRAFKQYSGKTPREFREQEQTL